MTDIIQGSAKEDKNILLEIQLNWLEKQRGIITARDVRDTVRVALPPAFGGTGDEWSPEHLFLGAIASCFMTTYLALAKKMGVEVSHYECDTKGHIGMVGGKYELLSVDLYPKVYTPDISNREKANTAMEKTQKYCLISGAIKSVINYHGEILLDSHPMPKHVMTAS